MQDNTPPPASDSTATVQRIVICPTCRKTVVWRETEPYRPFCSKKCQLIDFGEWASERHSIPAQSPPDEFDPDADDAQ